jgi:ribosome biogenesis GTPase
VEFLAHVPRCKFPDCTHTHENDCAVKAAVERGEIDVERYESYLHMYEDPGAAI